MILLLSVNMNMTTRVVPKFMGKLKAFRIPFGKPFYSYRRASTLNLSSIGCDSTVSRGSKFSYDFASGSSTFLYFACKIFSWSARKFHLAEASWKYILNNFTEHGAPIRCLYMKLWEYKLTINLFLDIWNRYHRLMKKDLALSITSMNLWSRTRRTLSITSWLTDSMGYRRIWPGGCDHSRTS